MAEPTQKDIDDALNDLNDTIQKKRGLPPIQAVPDTLAKPPPTEADVEAAMKDLNDTISAKQGATAQTKDVPQPARPNPFDYITKSALTAGANLGAGIMSGQPEAFEGAIPFFNGPAITPATPETTNKVVFGGNGQVIPPDPYSKYAGAAVGSIATNPLGAAMPIGTLGGAIGAGFGSQGGADLADAYLPSYLKPYATLLGGMLGGGMGQGASNMLGSARTAIGPPPVKGLTESPIGNGVVETPGMGSSPSHQSVEAALRNDPRTAQAFKNIDNVNNQQILAQMDGAFGNNDISDHVFDWLHNQSDRMMQNPENVFGHDPLRSPSLTDTNGMLTADRVRKMMDSLKKKGLVSDQTTAELEKALPLQGVEDSILAPGTFNKIATSPEQFAGDKSGIGLKSYRDSPHTPMPAGRDHPDVHLLNQIEDHLNRVDNMSKVTPANLSKEGVSALRRYIGGDPSWVDFAAPQALSLIATHGDPHIANLLASVPYATKLLAGPRVAATNRVRNDQAVRNILQSYTAE